MKNTRYVSLLLVIIVATALAGCRGEPAVSSPACADLQKTTDPAEKAEILKKCPRGDSEFKPSPVKNW